MSGGIRESRRALGGLPASAASAVTGKAGSAIDTIGGMASMSLEAFRGTPAVTKWWREWVLQCWFLARVTAVPVLLVAIPLGATISLQVGQFTAQLGAQSVTGSVVVLGLVREVAPIAAALLIAGAGGSAMAADMGSRNIRDELAAMEVMGVDPTRTLVTPRLWASSTVGFMLVAFVVIAGVGGGFVFNVLIQGVTPGAYFSGATSLVRFEDLASSLFKAWVFGFIAAVVSCHKGMNCDRGAIGAARAVNQAVVQTFIAVFIVNYVITAMYYLFYPPTI